MTCPYCQTDIDGFTGLLELMHFQRHLGACAKNPENIVLDDGQTVAVTPVKEQTVLDALEIRHHSGQ